jgi:hypothetical protein
MGDLRDDHLPKKTQGNKRKSISETGLEPAAYRLEVCRAAIAPPGTVESSLLM